MGLFQESMDPTLFTVGDEMPRADISPTRMKYIHTQGAVASVKLTNLESHPFTGIFAGADSGVVRLSFAGEPDITIQHTTPAMAIKFLRDGVDSANVVCSQSVDG